MHPLFAQGNSRTLPRLKNLRRQAQTDKAPRVVLRLQAIILSIQRQTTGQIAQSLRVDRTRVHAWISAWNEHGVEGLLEGYRSGRPAHLTASERKHLAEILEGGPAACGRNADMWTSPLIAQIIEEEFKVRYHPGHVRRLLGQMSCSLPHPKFRWVQAGARKQNRWTRYTHPT